MATKTRRYSGPRYYFRNSEGSYLRNENKSTDEPPKWVLGSIRYAEWMSSREKAEYFLTFFKDWHLTIEEVERG